MLPVAVTGLIVVWERVAGPGREWLLALAVVGLVGLGSALLVASVRRYRGWARLRW